MTTAHDNPQTMELTEEIARLEAAIEALTLKVDKQIKHHEGMDRHNNRVHNRIESRLGDAFERIKNMELTLFPNLSGDILRLHEIVPHDEKAWNPLDYRNP